MAQKRPERARYVREAALDTLLEVMEQDIFCDKAVHQVLQTSGWEKRDRSLYKRLVTGTVERAIELDYILNQFSKIKVKKMKPVIRNLLRMSLYQIFYMEKIPVSAVCNEAVKLTEKRKLYPLKGFVNGVLRTVLREKERISYPDGTDPVAALSVRYSMPEWLVRKWLSAYGKEVTEEIFQSFFLDKDFLTLRIQRSNITAERLEDSLEKEGVLVQKGVLFPFAYRIRNYPALEQLEAFQNGYFFIQDESSMLVGEISGVKKGDFVIDLCAAPGGKAMHIADLLEGTGTVVAADILPEKKRRIIENIQRLHVSNVLPVVNDARTFKEEWEEQADVVIADLPCSGLGIIGKKSDIKYKTKEEDILTLAALQKEILKTAARYVKPGGRLVYSTCTIAREENEENAAWIVKNLPFTGISIEETLPEKLQGGTGEKGYLQIMPNETGTDGFFVAAFQKKR